MPSGTSFPTSSMSLLEVAIFGALSLGHRAQASHPAIGFVGTALIKNHFTGSFIRAGKQ